MQKTIDARTIRYCSNEIESFELTHRKGRLAVLQRWKGKPEGSPKQMDNDYETLQLYERIREGYKLAEHFSTNNTAIDRLRLVEKGIIDIIYTATNKDGNQLNLVIIGGLLHLEFCYESASVFSPKEDFRNDKDMIELYLKMIDDLNYKESK